MIGAVLFLPFLPMLPSQILFNNFLYDLSQVSLPTDNVDEEYIRKTLIMMGIEQLRNKDGKIAQKRCKIPYIDPEGKILYNNIQSRPYVFNRKDIMSEEEFSEYSNEIVE